MFNSKQLTHLFKNEINRDYDKYERHKYDKKPVPVVKLPEPEPKYDYKTLEKMLNNIRNEEKPGYDNLDKSLTPDGIEILKFIPKEVLKIIQKDAEPKEKNLTKLEKNKENRRKAIEKADISFEDIQKYKRSLNPKPGEKLYQSLVKETKTQKKIKKKIPTVLKRHVKKQMAYENVLPPGEAVIPDNIMKALGNMTL